jgi:hypothetical protein
MKRIYTIVIFSLFASASVHAASYMEGVNDGGTMRVWINDNYARVKVTTKANNSKANAGPPGEMLLDIKHRKMYIIDHKTKSLVIMDGPPNAGQGQPQASRAKISIERKGRGPKVAGFSTEGYLFSANGRECYTLYASKDVMRYKQVVNYYKAMMDVSSHDDQSGNACDAADIAIDKMDIQKYGLPIRMLDKDGNAKFEIKEISQGKNPPKNYLRKPAGYKERSMMQVMQQMMQQQHH